MNQAILNKTRNDKFLMVLDLPKFLKTKYDNILDKNYHPDQIQFTTYGSPIPSVSVPSIDVPFDNQVYKASSLSRPSYQPLNVRFFIDNGYKNYWIIWKWLNIFNDSQTSKSDVHMEIMASSKKPKLENPMTELVSKFTIYALDEYNKKIVAFKYNHVFPVSLSEINFSHQDPSEISCTASFAFNQLNVELLKNVDEESC
jgi:hypothetical protein